MSVQITTAFVEQYSSNVEFLAQQMGSRFSGKVRNESQAGKSKFYEQVGATAAIKITSRHADTPRVDTNHQRRATFLNQYVWSDLVDQLDQVELLIDPTSAYAQNAAMAFNRAKDDEIIAAATGTAYADLGTGNGTVSAQVLPTAQKIVVNYISGGTGANSGLTLAKLVQGKSLLSAAEYPEGSKLYWAHRQRDLDNLLLNVTQVQDIRQNDVKALIAGEVNHFIGFEFVRSQRLAFASNLATNFAWVESGLLLATGRDARGRVSERADKNYSTQVFMDMSIGATRMQEAYVVQCITDATVA